jgi:hypothetical protein
MLAGHMFDELVFSIVSDRTVFTIVWSMIKV